jgi:KUP system potassium uptake protein
MAVSVASTEAHEGPAAGFWALTLGSIGVVFGDIGTSPLYAFRVAVTAAAYVYVCVCVRMCAYVCVCV